MNDEHLALPHSAYAECAVLAGVLLDNRQFEKVASLLTSADFYLDDGRAARIFRAIAASIAFYGKADLVTLRDELEREEARLRSQRPAMPDGEVVFDVGSDVAWVYSQMEGTARSGNVKFYATIVREKASRRAVIREAARLQHVAANGSTSDEFTQAIEDSKRILSDASPATADRAMPTPVSLASVAATLVEYSVRDLVRRSGVTLLYGPAGASKTLLTLRTATEMMAAVGGDTFTGAEKLFGHPDLAIRRPWRRALWVSAEETGGALRARWDMVLDGMQMKASDLRGEILFVWPFSERGSFTVDRLEEMLESVGGDFDAVILDSWTSLVPSMFEGRLIEWERDTFATRRLVNLLRDVASRRGLNIVIVHHEGLEKGRGRGNTELNRNTPDTILALEPLPDRRVKLRVAKQRDGRDKWEFVLALEFGGGAFRVRHEQQAERKLTDPQRDVLMFLRARGSASVADVVKGTGRTRSTVQRALEALGNGGEAVLTSETSESGSPVWSVPGGAHEVPTDE